MKLGRERRRKALYFCPVNDCLYTYLPTTTTSASGRSTCTTRPLCNRLSNLFMNQSRRPVFPPRTLNSLSWLVFSRIPIFDTRLRGKGIGTLSSFPVSDRQSVAFVHPCVDRRVDCWVAVAVLEGKLSFLPLKRAEYIYSGSTMSGQQGMRMALLGVQKLRVDARIGLLHRSKNNINSSSSIEKLETALLEIWKWPGAVSEKAKERERDKDGGQVKTVSLPGWKKVLAGNGTKWSWSIIKVALIRSKTFFI